MVDEIHDPLQCVTQLRQTLSADKLSIGFFLGAGCPCAVRVVDDDGVSSRAIIPDIKGLTAQVHQRMSRSDKCTAFYEALIATFRDDEIVDPTIEAMLNRIRAFRDVAGKVGVRGLSLDALNDLDREVCQTIRAIVTCVLPSQRTPYHALANFIGSHRFPFTEIFTTNYDVLMEQALERRRVPYFDGFIGSSRPFFDQRAIEDDEIPGRWSRLWKLHGSVNWRFNKSTKAVFRSETANEGDELLIHPSHLKYDESRRMPYFVMIDRLRTFLRHSERPVAMFVVGYSFSDEHINAAIIESLQANASAACFALLYNQLSDYPAARTLAKENSNLSLFAPDRAVIRRQEGRWLASATTDAAKLDGAFELFREEATAAQKKEATTDSDAPRPCRMTLGDFKILGDFLDEFSGFTHEDSAS